MLGGKAGNAVSWLKAHDKDCKPVGKAGMLVNNCYYN